MTDVKDNIVDSLLVGEQNVLHCVDTGEEKYLLFGLVDSDAKLNCYEVLNYLSSVLRDSVIGESASNDVEVFVTKNGFVLDSEIEADEEIFMTRQGTQIAHLVMLSMFPIYLKIFPSEILNDGFYGRYPLISVRSQKAAYERTLKGFVEKLFKCYRKDLVKLLLSENIDAYETTWASLFVDFLPTEWLMEYLNRTPKLYELAGAADEECLGDFFSYFSKYELRKFLSEDTESHILLSDTARIFSALPDGKKVLPEDKSIHFLHAHFSLITQNIDDCSQFPIPAKVEKIEGMKVAGYTVKILRSRYDYRTVGDMMENCAGSAIFSLDALEKKIVLVSFVDDDGEPKILMEISSRLNIEKNKRLWKINQVFRAKNEKLNDTENKLIYDFVKEKVNSNVGND